MINKEQEQFPIKQDYDFDVPSVFKRGLELSKGNNWTLVQALLCIIALYIAVIFIYIDAFNITDITQLLDPEQGLSNAQQLAIQLTLAVLLVPLWTGVSMLAIFSARAHKASFTDIFWYYRLLLRLVVGSLLISMAVSFGLMLFVVPGAYIATATTFALPLMADKKMGPISAILYSARVVNKHLAKMLLLCVVFILLMVLVFLSAGFAYLWVGPFYFNVKAILYQDLFCELVKKDDDAEPKKNAGTQKLSDKEGMFDA